MGLCWFYPITALPDAALQWGIPIKNAALLSVNLGVKSELAAADQIRYCLTQ